MQRNAFPIRPFPCSYHMHDGASCIQGSSNSLRCLAAGPQHARGPAPSGRRSCWLPLQQQQRVGLRGKETVCNCSLPKRTPTSSWKRAEMPLSRKQPLKMQARPRLRLPDSRRLAARGAVGAPCYLAGSCCQVGGGPDCLSGACFQVSEVRGRLAGHCKPSETSACRQQADLLQSLLCAAAHSPLSPNFLTVLQAAGTDASALRCAAGLCSTLCSTLNHELVLDNRCLTALLI